MAYKQKMARKVPEGDNLSSLVRARSPPPVSQGIAPLLNNMSIFFHFILIQIHIDKGIFKYFWRYTFYYLSGKQGCPSGEKTTHLLWCGPGSNPGGDAKCGFSLLLVLSLAPRGFSSGTPVFPSRQKTTFSNSNSTWNARTHELKRVLNNY